VRVPRPKGLRRVCVAGWWAICVCAFQIECRSVKQCLDSTRKKFISLRYGLGFFVPGA
jgi:hypothetical protein